MQSQPEPGLERYALIIGAAQYRSLPSRSDYARQARAMARHAEQSGYALISGGPVLNPTEYELRRAIDILGRLTEGGAEAFIYFAGHAIPGQDTIFLLSTDSEPPPLVLYAEGGMRLEEAWSHPIGSGPSSTVIVIETEGVGGLFSGGISAFGTGFDTLEVPDSVTVAISDRGGPVTVEGNAFHRVSPARPRLIFEARDREDVRPAFFTPSLVELRLLEEADLTAALELASLHVHEYTSGQLSPVIFDRSLLDVAPPARSEPPAIVLAETELLIDEAPPPDLPGSASVTADLVLHDTTDIILPAARSESQAGQSVIELIQMFEAFRGETYLDAAGIPTIGYGHTGREARTGNVITHGRAVELLMEDIDIAAAAVDAAVTRPLTDNQRNALISLVFNIGGQAFRNSTLLRLINSDIHSVSAAQFLRWVHARVPGSGMRALRGLESRRQLEAFLFLVEEDSVTARELIISFEPFRASATRVRNCSVIGYGRALRPCEEEFDTQISQVEALQYLRRELVQIESELRALVGVPVSQAQMAALVSFVHQNGLEAFERSRILARLNQGDYTGAANALRLHNAFTGAPAMQVGQSQIERRAAEAALFFAHGGDYVVMPGEAAS
ncbi:glycoside hydrolase family protein [Glycocaulis abyssi]|uniref:glycoside hydrolase family protein n=1 Tax=Glycocaulis abyssi TaxID=1433403 RepID=UPI00352A1152